MLTYRHIAAILNLVVRHVLNQKWEIPPDDPFTRHCILNYSHVLSSSGQHTQFPYIEYLSNEPVSLWAFMIDVHAR